MKMLNGTFWPIPITLSVSKDEASNLIEGQQIALIDDENNQLMGTMTVVEKYTIDKVYECQQVFKTDDIQHPGVAKVMAQGQVNIGGPVKVFSESDYPENFKSLYAPPEETRKLFEEKEWKTIAALQLRNPMHRSHEYLAKIALEMCDGLFIHQLIGKLKGGIFQLRFGLDAWMFWWKTIFRRNASFRRPILWRCAMPDQGRHFFMQFFAKIMALPI